MASAWRRLVDGRWAQRLVQTFGMPKDRRAQEMLDLQRAYLFASLNAAETHDSIKTYGGTAAGLSAGGKPANINYHRILLESQQGTLDEHRTAVSAHVRRRLLAMADAIHQELQQAGDQTAAAASLIAATADNEQESLTQSTSLASRWSRWRAGKTQGAASDDSPDSLLCDDSNSPNSSSSSRSHVDGRGNISSSGHPASTSSSSGGSSSIAPGGHRMSLDALSDACLRRVGHGLFVAPSKIQHPDAGLGLFLRGAARTGDVVALVPGLVYRRTQYRHMPNYPKIDLDNDYLSSTYDMAIVDSLAWMRASGQSVASPSSTTTPTASQASAGNAARSACGSALLTLLDSRHPWALGHYVNHPPQGSASNVLELGFSLTLREDDAPWLRAYLPFMPFQMEPVDVADLLPPCTVSGLVLMATRSIADGEELLLNYRLNPHVPRPAWYHAHTPEEEERRWAKLSYASAAKPRQSANS